MIPGISASIHVIGGLTYIQLDGANVNVDYFGFASFVSTTIANYGTQNYLAPNDPASGVHVSWFSQARIALEVPTGTTQITSCITLSGTTGGLFDGQICPPDADNQTVILLENTPTAIVLTSSDVVTFALDTSPLHGSLSGFVPSTGHVTYTPAVDFHGHDSFTFHTNDGSLDSVIATVTIIVNPTATLSGTLTTSGTLNNKALLVKTGELSPTSNLVMSKYRVPDGVVGEIYSGAYQTTSSPVATPWTYDIASGELPPGVVLDPVSGTLSGVPTRKGIYSFTIRATH